MMSWDKRSPALIDTDRMPFGQHKGKLMKDIPAHYLHWLYNKIQEDGGPNQSNDLVFNYIWNVQDALRLEGYVL